MGGIVGFVALTLLSYIFIVLHIPFLIIPISIILTIWIYKPFIAEVRNIRLKFDFQTIITILVFVVGIAIQLAVISPSGTYQNGDLVFWSAHGHDATWHIALMEEIKKGYPLQNPSFAGQKLVNYHFFSDVLPAMVSKYTPISNLDLYFRVFPLIYSLFLGASAFYLTKRMTGSFGASIWAVVFTYFAGSFGFIVTYLKNKTIAGESIFWATQPQSSSGNPPQIISNFLVLTGLYFLLKLLREKGKLNFAICVLLLGTLSAFKIYAGFVLLLAIGMTGIWQLIKNKQSLQSGDRKTPQLLLLTFLSGILAAILYFPNSSGGASFLIFQPWWYIRTMIVEPSRLNFLDWELKRQTYVYEHNLKRVIFLEGLGLTIFFFGNLGMRFIGLFDFIKQAKLSFKNYFSLIFMLVIILSIVLPLLFLQRGVAGNTSQFLQYFVLLFGILAGISTNYSLKLLKYPVYQILFSTLLVVLMVPTQAGLYHELYSRPAFAKISKNELEALRFVKENTNENDVILTPPYNSDLNLKDSTPNIWDWFDTSYIPTFSSRRVYMDDYEQNDIMGYDYKSRLEIKRLFFESKGASDVDKAFSKTNANIVYFPKIQKPNISPREIGLSLIFENSDVEVWKAN